MHQHTPTSPRRPEDFGWTAEDLRSAYAVDGSGPYRYAPDGSGPFSYDPDGSGPWLVGPSAPAPVPLDTDDLEALGTFATAARFAPRGRGSWSRGRRVVRSLAGGALALGVVAGSVGIVVAAHSSSTADLMVSALH